MSTRPLRINDDLKKELDKIRKSMDVNYPTASKLLARELKILRSKKDKKEIEKTLDLLDKMW